MKWITASLGLLFVMICIYLFFPQIPTVNCEKLSVICSLTKTEWVAILIVFAIAILGSWWMAERDKKRTYGKRLKGENINLNYVDIPKKYNDHSDSNFLDDC